MISIITVGAIFGKVYQNCQWGFRATLNFRKFAGKCLELMADEYWLIQEENVQGKPKAVVNDGDYFASLQS